MVREKPTPPLTWGLLIYPFFLPLFRRKVVYVYFHNCWPPKVGKKTGNWIWAPKEHNLHALYRETPTITHIGETHMTIILTLVGVIVFFISLFTVGFKSAWKRLMTLAVTGLVLDVLIATFYAVVLYVAL